ncbi:MAG: hypothetical protein E6Q97_18390 [Desulfurellales bacterium]|nr:MAG: hypothetical protein E6Q97_18390 [Desulfurellales bacterium]
MALATIRPDGAGSATVWTPTSGANWENVDEASADDDSGYNALNQSTGLGGDLFTTDANIPSGATSISVELKLRARATSAFASVLQVYIKTNGSTYASQVTSPTLGTSYADYSKVFATNPVTGAAWTDSEINALEIGYYGNVGAGTALVTQCYADVTYTPVGIEATPGTAALTLTTYAPTVQLPKVVTPGVKALTLTGYAPTIVNPRTVTPGVLALVLTAYAATVTASQDSPVVVPDVKALVLTTFAPIIEIPGLITTFTLALVLTSYAPSIAITDLKVATPSTASLALATYAPIVSVAPPIIVNIGRSFRGGGAHFHPRRA